MRIFLCIFTLILASVAGGAIRYVPVDHATVQAGVNATAAGDTLYVGTGTYAEVVSITVDGNSGAWVNIVSHPTNATRAKVLRFDYSSANYVRVIGFEITHEGTAQTGRGFANAGTSTHLEILDNYVHHTEFDAIQLNGVAQFVVIRGNRLDYAGNRGGALMPAMNQISSALTGSTDWLVEYNHLTRQCDGMDLFVTRLNVRNNWMYNVHASYFSAIGHPDFFQPGSDGNQSDTKHQNYERNWTGFNTNLHAHFGIWQDNPPGHGDTNIMIRQNVGFRTGSGVGAIGTSKFNALNNSFFDQAADDGAENSSGGFIAQDSVVPFKAVNNVMQNDNGSTQYAFYAEEPSSGLLSHNWGFQLGDTYSSPNVIGTTDPLFVSTSYAAPDLKLQPSSPLRGAGTNTIWVTSNTTATAFHVNDAQLLWDGEGLSEGDVVVIGSTTTRVVMSDWTNNVIHVATSVTVTNLQPIWFGRLGDQKDIGAYPYGAAFLTSATYLTSGGTATISTVGDARKVWRYRGGIPLDEDYDAPFSFTGHQAGDVYKVYAEWSQGEPVVTATAAGEVGSSPYRNKGRATRTASVIP